MDRFFHSSAVAAKAGAPTRAAIRDKVERCIMFVCIGVQGVVNERGVGKERGS
jgi:hypothetical protein